jgi:hypothetical protein
VTIVCHALSSAAWDCVARSKVTWMRFEVMGVVIGSMVTPILAVRLPADDDAGLLRDSVARYEKSDDCEALKPRALDDSMRAR